MRSPSIRSTVHLALASAVVVVTVGCGSSDGDAEPVSTGGAAQATGSSESSEGGNGDRIAEGEVADQLLDGMGEQGQTVGDAISALPDETFWGIVAEQLDADPDVDIDGNEIRLSFSDGSVDDAIFACMVGGSFVEQGQTLTLVYPDGEHSCG